MRRHETLDCQCGSSVDGTVVGLSATRTCASAGTGTLCTTIPSLNLILSRHQRVLRWASQVGATIAVKRN
jgi:hypothetical protein